MRSLPALLLAAFVLGGCQLRPGGPAAGARATRGSPQILASGTLRVAVSADRAPLNFKNPSDEIVGFEVDIVQALATAMGLELSLVQVPFAELLASLESGRADLAISGLTMTPERNARVAFAGPYFVSGMSVLSRSSEIAEVEDPEALDVAGRRYAAVSGSTSARFVRESCRARARRVGDYDDRHPDGDRRQGRRAVRGLPGLCRGGLANPEAGSRCPRHRSRSSRSESRSRPMRRCCSTSSQNYLATLDYTGLLASYRAKWLADGEWIVEELRPTVSRTPARSSGCASARSPASGARARRSRREPKKRTVLLTEYDDAKVGRESAQGVKAELGVIEDTALAEYVSASGRSCCAACRAAGSTISSTSSTWWSPTRSRCRADTSSSRAGCSRSRTARTSSPA